MMYRDELGSLVSRPCSMEEDDGLVLNLAGTDDPLPQEPLKPRDSRNRWIRQHEQKKKVKPT